MEKSLKSKRLFKTLLCTFLLTILFTISAFAEEVYLNANGQVIQSKDTAVTTITLKDGAITNVSPTPKKDGNYGDYTDRINQYIDNKANGSGNATNGATAGSGSGSTTGAGEAQDVELTDAEKMEVIKKGPMFNFFYNEIKTIYGTSTLDFNSTGSRIDSLDNKTIMNPVALLSVTYSEVNSIIHTYTSGTIYAVLTALACALMIVFFLADLTSKDIPQNFGTNSGDLMFFIKPVSKLVIGMILLINVPKIITGIINCSQFVFEVALKELTGSGSATVAYATSPVYNALELISVALGIFGTFILIPGIVTMLKGMTDHDGGDRTAGAQKVAIGIIVLVLAVLAMNFKTPITNMLTSAAHNSGSASASTNATSFDADAITIQLLKASGVKVKDNLGPIDFFTNLGKMIFIIIMMFIPYVIAMISNLMLIWTVISRMFNMILQAILAPLAFTDFYSERPFTDTRAFGFCRDFLGIAFQSTVILLAFAVSESLLSRFATILLGCISGSIGDASIIAQIGLFFGVLRFTQATVVMGSANLSKKVFGA